MALNDYRWRINNPPVVGGQGDLHFDMFVEISNGGTPETWANLEQGHYTLVMPATALLAISNGAGTVTQKRALVMEWITAQVKLRGVSLSDQAKRALITLLPGGVFPVGGISQVFVP
jgi:hypothetical protein